MRVLYLEDNPGDADLTRRELRKSDPGMQIETVSTIKDAMDRLDALETAIRDGQPSLYDLALLDMHLPDGSGLSVAGHIRHRSLPLATVVLTGSGDEESVLSALRAGADDYVAKRHEYWSQLSRTLRSALDSFRSKNAKRMRPIRLLCAEPNEADIRLMRRHLAMYAPFIRVEVVHTGAEMLARLPLTGPCKDADVLLLDYRLPDMNALELLKELNQIRHLGAPTIINTGLGSEDVAIQAIKLGAADYIVKSQGYLDRLPLVVENVFYRARAEREQEALRESELRLRTIIETDPECVQVLGTAGEILEMNRAGLTMLEAESMESVRGRDFRSFLGAGYEESFASLFGGVMAGRTGKLEFQIVGLKGKRLWVDTHAAPMRNAAGGIATFLGITRDITERKNNEERLRQTQKMNAFGQLAGGVAHDFNNQLAAIQGYAEMLSARLTQPDLKRFAASIETAAKRSAELTRNLLTFARQAPSQSIPLDVHALVNETMELLDRTIDKRITVSSRLLAEPSTIMGDPSQFQNALLNLALNARDSMPEGGDLSFSTEIVALGAAGAGPAHREAVPHSDPNLNLADGLYLHLSIADSGHGMTEEVKRRLFEPFFTTKPIGKGTGMGLASVFGTVKIHHGAITLASEPGHGTVFHLYFPSRDQGVDNSARIAIKPAVGRLGLLVVDDEPMLRELLADLLIQEGHVVYTAGDGREAVKVYRDARARIDLVILDMIMPEMGGRDTYRALTEINPDIRVLLSSGYTPNEEIQEILDEGILGLLHKPYTKAHMDSAIAKAMQPRASQTGLL